MVKRITSISETPSDGSLAPEQGWIKMDLKWLVTEHNLGSRYLTFGRTVFAPGGSAQHALHRHPNAEEVMLVLRGHIEAITGEETRPMGPGDVCFIPQGVPHSHRNRSTKEPAEIIFVYGGAPSLEKAGYEVL